MNTTPDSSQRLFFRLTIVSGLIGLALLWPTVGHLNPQQRTTTQTPTDYRIRLRAYTFDPLRDQPNISSELRSEQPRGPAYYIIQFTKSPTRQEKARLKQAYDLKLTDYIPNFAYLEKVTPQTLAAISRDPLFRSSTLIRHSKFRRRLALARFAHPSGEP